MSAAVEWDAVKILNDASIAVIILNQPISCTADVLLPIWERAKIRLTADGGTNRWRTFIEALPSSFSPSLPHCISGDMDSITPETKAFMQERNVPFEQTPDQDYTDFTKALRVVQGIAEKTGRQVDYIVAVCENAGRLDQTLGNLETLFHAQTWDVPWRTVILASNTLTWLCPKGTNIIRVPPVCVSKRLPCGLIPLLGATKVTTCGLKWDLDEGVLEFGVLVSTSNTFAKSEVTLVTSKSLIWTVQFTEDA